MAALTAVACVIIMLPGDLKDFGASLMAASGFAANLYFWQTSGYFAATAYSKPLLHMWSLSVEEQFYIFAPFLFYAVHRFGKRRWILFLAPILAISLAGSIAAVFVAPKAGFFLLPTRAWELLNRGPGGPGHRARAWSSVAAPGAGGARRPADRRQPDAGP